MTAICTRFRVANLSETLWIPAFAGMTGVEIGNDRVADSGNDEGI